MRFAQGVLVHPDVLAAMIAVINLRGVEADAQMLEDQVIDWFSQRPITIALNGRMRAHVFGLYYPRPPGEDVVLYVNYKASITHLCCRWHARLTRQRASSCSRCLIIADSMSTIGSTRCTCC